MPQRRSAAAQYLSCISHSLRTHSAIPCPHITALSLSPLTRPTTTTRNRYSLSPALDTTDANRRTRQRPMARHNKIQQQGWKEQPSVLDDEWNVSKLPVPYHVASPHVTLFSQRWFPCPSLRPRHPFSIARAIGTIVHDDGTLSFTFHSTLISCACPSNPVNSVPWNGSESQPIYFMFHPSILAPTSLPRHCSYRVHTIARRSALTLTLRG